MSGWENMEREKFEGKRRGKNLKERREEKNRKRHFMFEHELTFKNITECIDSEGNTYEQSKDLFR